MQRKWFAIVLTLAFFSLAVICFAEEESTASNQDTVTYSVELNSDRSLDIIINENYYNSIDSDHTITWSYKGLGEDYSSLILGQDYDETDYTFNLNSDDTVGKYVLNLIPDSDVSQKTVVLMLKCVISITIQDGINGERIYKTNPLYVKVSISFQNGSDLPSELKYRIGGGDPLSLSRIDVKEGEPVSMIPELIGTTSAAQVFRWYAKDLPKGLAMTHNGVITGVPVEHDYTAKPSYIYIEDGFGNSKQFNLTILVMKQNTAVNYYLCNGQFTSSTEVTTLPHEPSQFMTERDRLVTLAVNKNVSVSVVSFNETELSRTTVPLNEEITNYGTNYYCFTLPTEGTGVYKVILTDPSDDKKLDTFDLYVMSKLVAVESEIIVGSDSTN